MAFVSEKSDFESTIMNQSLWGNKFVTHNVGCKRTFFSLGIGFGAVLGR